MYLYDYLGAPPTTLTNGHLYRQRFLVLDDPNCASLAAADQLEAALRNAGLDFVRVMIWSTRHPSPTLIPETPGETTPLSSSGAVIGADNPEHFFALRHLPPNITTQPWESDRRTFPATDSLVGIPATEREQIKTAQKCFVWAEGVWLGGSNVPLQPVILSNQTPIDFWDASTGEIFFDMAAGVPVPPAQDTVPKSKSADRASATSIAVGAIVGGGFGLLVGGPGGAVIGAVIGGAGTAAYG